MLRRHCHCLIEVRNYKSVHQMQCWIRHTNIKQLKISSKISPLQPTKFYHKMTVGARVFVKKKIIPENRHTAEERCPGIATAMTCPAGNAMCALQHRTTTPSAFAATPSPAKGTCLRRNRGICYRKAGWIPPFGGMTEKNTGAFAPAPVTATVPLCGDGTD